MLSRSDKLKRKRINKFLSFVVICVTLSILILPAFTLEKKDDDTNDNNGPATAQNINEQGGSEESSDSTLEPATNNNNEDSSSEEDVMLLSESGTATTTTGFDLNNNTDKVDSIKFSYKDDNNEWHDVTDDSVTIPADKELKLTVKFKDIPIQALKDEYNATIVYSIPSILRYQNGNGTIHNDNNEVVGTTEISNGKIYLKYDATHLQELINKGMNILETGGFEIEGSANLSELPDDGKYTLNANKEYKFNFGNEPKAEYAKLFISKNQDSKTIFVDGKNYLKYTITVSTGEDGCPNAVVVDTIKNNENLVSFVGIDKDEKELASTENKKEPFEVRGDGKTAGKIYKGKIPTDNTIPNVGASDIAEPGALVWNIGKMEGNESRTLTYYVELKDNVPLNKGNNIVNHADAYSVGNAATYKKGDVETTFTPKISYDLGSMKKGTVEEPTRNPDGSYTVKYKASFMLYENNTNYTLNNFELWDYLDFNDGNTTDSRILEYIEYDRNSIKLFKKKSEETSDTEIASDKYVVSWLDGSNNDSTKPTRFKIVGSDGNPLTLGPGDTYSATYTLKVQPEALAKMRSNTVKITNRFIVNASNAKHTSFDWDHIDKIFNDKYVGEYIWDDKTYEAANVGTITMDGDKYDLTNNTGKIEDTGDVINTTINSFEVPDGSYKYTIKANYIFDDWNISEILMKDEFKPNNLAYVGYMRIDAYEYKENAEGTKDYVPFGTKWVNIDGLHSFSLKPSALGWNASKLAYTITYYAKPFNEASYVHSVVDNDFILNETVGRNGVNFSIRVSSKKSVTVSGSYKMSVIKSEWNYAPPTVSPWSNGALYWVIEIDTDLIKKDTIFRDTLLEGTSTDKAKSYLHNDSLVGIYKAKISDGKKITDYKSLTELNDNENLEEITNEFTSTYSYDSGYSEGKYNNLSIQAKEDITIEDGKKVYVIVMSEPEKLPVNYRDTYTFSNKVSTSENGGSFVEKNTASKTLYDAPYILKELGQTFTYDGSRIVNIEEGTDRGDTNRIVKDELSPGLYASWAFKLNYAGDMSGKYKVFETIPSGLKLAYVRIKWVGDEQRKIGYITSSEISGLVEDSWEKKTITAITDNNNTVTTTYYVKGNKVQMEFEDFTAGHKRDDYSLDVQVVCRVIDSNVLLGNEEKTYTNKVELQMKDGTPIPATSTATLKNQNIDKTMIDKPKNDGKIDFLIKLNPLGQDLLPNSNIKKIKLIDKLSESLILDPSTIKVVKTDTNIEVVHKPSLKDGNILEIEIPCNEALTITYTTIINAPPDKTVSISNEAYWEGYSSTEGSTVNKEYKYSVSATSSAGSNPTLKIIKNDENDVSKLLADAEFEMYECKMENDGTFTITGSKWDSIKTGADGTLTFGEGSTNNPLLKYNTVYKIIEKTPPNGYVVNSEPIYIMFPKTTSDESINNYVNECEKDERIIKKYVLPFELYVKNHRGEITVEKKFKNAGGYDTGPISGTYLFGLYDRLDNQLQTISITYNPSDTVPKTNKFVDLDLSQTYYVYELNASGNPIKDPNTVNVINGMEYLTSYDKNAATNGDTVTVTNRVVTKQLPATGGNGTDIYIKSGAILMLLTGVVLLKRRR